MTCGPLSHLTKDCTAAEVPRDTRPCWKCGEPGHISAQCTSGAATLVDHEGLFNCIVCRVPSLVAFQAGCMVQFAARYMFGPREPAQACGLRMNKAGGEVLATLEVVRAWHAVSRRVLRKDGE